MKTELHSVSILPVKLSDGSIAWNVEQTTETGRLIFAAVDKQHAKELADVLVKCSWVEVIA